MFSRMKNAWAPRVRRDFSLAIILGLLLPVLGCGGRSSEWRGKIEVVNGVTVVKNPREGIWDSQGRPGLSMIDVRRIGTMEGAEETAFAEISDVAVDSRGDIYVGDGKLCEVRKFAADGRHLLTFGRKGQGPGEFQSVKTVSVGPEGQIILFDDMMQRLSEFSEDGRLLKVTRRLDETRWIGPTRVFRSGDGYVLFGGYALLQKAEDGLKLFHEFGPDGAPGASYIDYEFGDNREFEENSIGFFPGQCDFQGPDDICYAHYYYDNRILVYKDKKLARVLERQSGIPKPYDVLVFRDVDKAIALQREYEFGTFGRGVAFLGTAYQNSLGLFRLPDGRIVNFLSTRREKGRRDLAVELYDASGRLLTCSVLGENPALDVRRVDGNGLFYAIERKDFPKIVMFRLSF
jgi:hypothetical protein